MGSADFNGSKILPRYKYCGQTILSNTLIHELQNANDSAVTFRFNLQGAVDQTTSYNWSHQWYSSSGEQGLSYCKLSSYHWLRFHKLADFQISSNVKEITCYPTPETPHVTIRHLLLDQVLPRCLAQQGKVMLHASAVRLEQKLLLITGDSGSGKSTLAGNFHQEGNPALSDDCVWIQENKYQIGAIPSYGGLRLWEDSLRFLFASEQASYTMAHYSSKKRISLNKDFLPEAEGGIPILAVIVISSPDQDAASGVSLELLSHREAFIAILKQTFQLDLTDMKRMTRHAQTLGRIVPRLPSYRLSMPHDYALLPRARQMILEAVQ